MHYGHRIIAVQYSWKIASLWPSAWTAHGNHQLRWLAMHGQPQQLLLATAHRCGSSQLSLDLIKCKKLTRQTLVHCPICTAAKSYLLGNLLTPIAKTPTHDSLPDVSSAISRTVYIVYIQTSMHQLSRCDNNSSTQALRSQRRAVSDNMHAHIVETSQSAACHGNCVSWDFKSLCLTL